MSKESGNHGFFELPGGLVHFVSDEVGLMPDRPSPLSQSSIKQEGSEKTSSQGQLKSLYNYSEGKK